MEKGGLVGNKFFYVIIFIFSSLLVVAVTLSFENLSSNETSNSTTESINITTSSNESVNSTNYDSNFNNTTNQNPESNINTPTETPVSIVEIPRFETITYNSEENSRILDAKTEVHSLGNGLLNAVVYSGDIFKHYNNEWHTLISLANISYLGNNIKISYDNDNYYLLLKPYLIYNNTKISFSDLNSGLQNQININHYLIKNRDYFEFGSNFSNIGITEIGFDYESNVQVTSFNNKTYINGVLSLDYSDLIKTNYTIFVNDSLIKITNIKEGFNDLDPFVQYNSTSDDGYILNNSDYGYSIYHTNPIYSGFEIFDTYRNDYMAFVNFNTFFLGLNSNITKAVLGVKSRYLIDYDEFGANCAVNHTVSVYMDKNLLGDNGLSSDDWGKGFSQGTLTYSSNNQQKTLNVNVSLVNVTGTTGFRFNQGDSGSCITLLTELRSSYDTVAANRPYLNLTYAYIVTYDLSYDANGNLISGFGKYYEYDGFNRLIRVRQINSTGTIIAEYVYDHEGNRIKKIEVQSPINQTTYYIGNFIQIRNSSGIFNITYYYDGDLLVGEKRYDGNTYYYHPDHLGSTQLVTDQNGNVVENTNYDPYGLVMQGGSSRYLFTGKEKDRETNFEYYGARYYMPYIARFVQPDPIIQDYYNPQALNRYSYVLNNPYRYTDPTGNFFETALDIGFISLDIRDIANDPSNWINYAALGGDIAGAATPFLTGVGVGIKAGSKAIKAADKAGDVAKTTDSAKIAGKIGDIKKDILFEQKKIQHEFKHASDFGVKGNYNKENALKFQIELEKFTRSKDTLAIEGTFRGTQKGIHYFDSKTNRWVFVDSKGQYTASHKLGKEQIDYLLTKRNVQ